MRRKKPIVEKILGQVSKKLSNLEEEYFVINNNNCDLDLMQKVVVGDDFRILMNLTDKEYEYLIDVVYKDDKDTVFKLLQGARFISQNGIELYPIQEEALNTFFAKVVGYHKNLIKNKERVSKLEGLILSLEDLEIDLQKAKDEGIVDGELVKKIISVLKIENPEEKSDLIDQILQYNLTSYNKLINSKTEEKEEIIVEKKEPLDKETVRLLFEKYGFEFNSINKDYIKDLCENGSLENIDGVFRAIRSNKIVLLDDKRESKLLVQFLLYSSEDIINRVCSLFKENCISSDYFKSYVQIFFESENKNGEHKRKHFKRKDKDDSTPNDISTKKDGLSVVGYHRDFLKNVEYLSKEFDVDKKTLIERNCMLLMRTNESILRHIEELELYGFDIHSDKFPLSTLSASKIMESIDAFIEVGEEKYIKDVAPSRLLLTCNKIAERIYAYKVHGLDYRSDRRYGAIKNEVTNLSTQCELMEETIRKTIPCDVDVILKNNKYSELLDENEPRKISNHTLNNPVIKALDESEHKVSDSLYSFEGVKISRRKLLRNFEFLLETDQLEANEKDIEKMLLVSAIKGSIITSEQIEKVDRAINGAIIIGGGSSGLSKK